MKLVIPRRCRNGFRLRTLLNPGKKLACRYQLDRRQAQADSQDTRPTYDGRRRGQTPFLAFDDQTEHIGADPEGKRDHEQEPLLRVAGQVGHCQDYGHGEQPAHLTLTLLGTGPEGPGKPARGPDVRIMSLERLGQQVRRSLKDTGRDRGRPSAQSLTSC